MKTEYDDLYKKWADELGLDWKLVKAVALTESDETPDMVCDRGESIGLMQLKHWWWLNYTREDMFDPDHNIECGAKAIAYLTDKYGIEGGIQAYNRGETAFLKGELVPQYLAKVMGYYDEC